MRESMGKYRGKSLKTGEWLYGGLINNLFFNRESKVPVCYILDCMKIGDYDCFEDLVDYFDDLEVDPDTVGEFTGLKDKYRNDKEVYSDDIYTWFGITYPITINDYQGYRFMFGKDLLTKEFIEGGHYSGTIHDKEKT